MKVLKDEYGKVEIYDSYAITTVNEGVTIKPLHNRGFKRIAEEIFPNKNFGYISNRINSYSIDPKIYIETSKIENLVAFAVVSKNPIQISISEIEKIFLKKPFKHFTDLEESIKWIKEKVEDSNS